MEPTNLKKRELAVFDVDWTMHGSALGTNLIHEMLKAGIIQADFDIEKTYETWQNSSDPGVIFMSHYHELFKKMIGLDEHIIRELGQKVGELAAATIYPFIEREIAKHRKHKRFLLLISNSPSIALESFAKKLGFDDYSGGNFEFDQAGKLHTMHSTSGRLKSDELQRLAKLHNLTLKNSYGYGDSADDISMLELVEHAHAISPKPELLERATKEKWKVINVR